MNVSRDRLSVIGKLIGIYREERRGNTQNSFTLKKFCEGICSINTLKNIEAGGLSRSEDVYIELLDKLDLKFGEFPVIDEALNTLTNELYRAIEYYDCDDISIIVDKMLRLLNEVKNYVYYSEYISLVKDVEFRYIHDHLISKASMDRYNKILDIMPYKIKNILKILIYTKFRFDNFGNPKAISNEYKRLAFKGEYSCFGILELDYLYLNDKFIDLSTTAAKLENYFIENNNLIKALDVYNYQIAAFNDANSQINQRYIEKVLKYINSHELPILKVSEIYYNLASLYYRNCEYEMALRYFEKVVTLDLNAKLPEYLFIADCQNHLGLRIDIPDLTNDDLSQYPLNLRYMYKYFKIEGVPDFIKQNYIMKKILPNLYDIYFINIFRYELEKLVEKTNHYKNIYLFDKHVNANLN